MRRHISYFSVLCFLSIWSQQAQGWAASAVSTPVAAHETAAAVIADAQDVIDKKKAAAEQDEAAAYARKAVEEAAIKEKQAADAHASAERLKAAEQTASVDAAATVAGAQEAQKNAGVLNEAAQKAEQEAQAAFANADAVEAAVQAEEDAWQKQAARIESQQGTEDQNRVIFSLTPAQTVEDQDELLKMEREIKSKEGLLKQAEALRRQPTSTDVEAELPEVDWSRAEQAHAQAERMNKLAEAADRKAEAAARVSDAKTAQAEAAATKQAEANLAADDARLDAAVADDDLAQARSYVLQTKQELAKMLYAEAHPADVHTASDAMRYYQWRDSNGNHGYQLLAPLGIGYWQKDFSYSLSTSYILSRNDTAGGSVSTVGDTALNLTKRNEKRKFIVDYSLDMNLPTGQTALSWKQRYAMMNEDLLGVSQFGEGWKVTPGIDVGWNIGSEDRWTVGSSYTFKGAYNPAADIANAEIHPGSEWEKHVRWQHAGQDYQLVGEVIHTTSGSTSVADGSNYDTGARWEYRLTYNRKVAKNQNLMFYYWREDQKGSAVVPSDTSSAVGHYFGTMWSRQINAKRTLRASFDVMKSDGSRYDRIYNYYDASGNPQYTSVDVDGRTKYTLGVGYDLKLSAKSSISLDLQTFRMHDGASTLGEAPKTYKGVNAFLQYNRTF